MSAAARGANFINISKLRNLALKPRLLNNQECSLKICVVPQNLNITHSFSTESSKTEEPQAKPKSDPNGHKSDEKRKDTWAEAEENERREKENLRTEADREQNIKTQILNAALKHVKTHGWSKLSLSSGAEDLGYISIVSGLFDRGGDELILHHVKTCNKNLDTWMANEVARYKESGTKLPITNFIKSAVKERLLMNSEFIQAGVWGEALALLAKPQNVPESVGYLQELSDDIWHRAGDTSADLNWYSKRMLLAGIISSTEVFMIQDLSTNFEETWKFMDRRFEDISGIPQLGKLPQDVSGILSGLVTTARNIAGIQK